RVAPDGTSYVMASFSRHDCQACAARPLCTKNQQQGRRVRLPPRDQYEALATARTWYASEAARQTVQQRAGVGGPLSQGVRAYGLRRTRSRGLEKTHVQHIAIAAAINLDRIVAWLEGRLRAQTRTSRFAALAPACALPAERRPKEAGTPLSSSVPSPE